MQNREFENKVQGKMEELKLTPSDAVWDKVEASLPKEKKRRWVIFILLFTVLMTGGLFVWNGLNKNAVTNTAKETRPKDEVNHDSIATANIIENKKSPDTIANFLTISHNSTTATSLHKNKKESFATRTSIKIKRPTEESLANNRGESPVSTNQEELVTKGNTKIKVKKPGVGANEEVIAKAANVTIIAKADNVPVAAMKDTMNIPATIVADSIASVKKDTAMTATRENKKIKKLNPWHYGIELAGGTSNVKNNLFSSGSVYADNFSTAVGLPGGGNPGSTSANKPGGSKGLTAGFYAEKNISKKWIFKTGLSYLYQSNTIKVGKKIDSVINFSLDVNKSLTANSYYQAGDATSYKNNFHQLEIPLIFQYQFPGSSRFYAAAGPSITYLTQSNALVYSPQSKAYVTDKNIFNKLGISINGEVAIRLAKNTAIPFSIGYKFKYSVGSIVKTSFGKQHFINSFLYLKVPFKK
jgi:hypothetical protein